jgi:hypothetical protein
MNELIDFILKMFAKPSKNELLQAAVLAGDESACRRLLAAGADPNWRGSDLYSPLMRAARANNHSLVQQLLDHGAEVDFVSGDGRRPLTVTWDRQIIQLLLDRGASLAGEQALQLMNDFNGDSWARELLASRGLSFQDWEDSPRQLYFRILDYDGNTLSRDVLMPSVAAMRDLLATLEKQKEYLPEGKAGSAAGSETERWELQQLYAFSRVNDALLLSFQKAADPSSTKEAPPAVVSRREYVAFFAALGFTPFECNEFHPFSCEIVSVENDVPDDSQPQVVDSIWPGLCFGKLLFSRQGVALRAGKNIIDRTVCESSTLYFTYWRRRPTNDLSAGWGHNSQWRTPIRRDYDDAEYYYYNVGNEALIDADAPPPHVDDYDRTGLSPSDLIELIRCRQLVRSPNESLIGFAYGHSLRERKCP